ncbi:MAG: hypothetical protein ACE5F9_15720, partial [Phycisphaerae bacterium]
RAHADLERPIRTAPVRKRRTTGDAAGMQDGRKPVEQAWTDEVREAPPDEYTTKAVSVTMPKEKSP